MAKLSARQIVQVVIRAIVVLIGLYVVMMFVPKILYSIPWGWSTYWERPWYSNRDELTVAIPLLAIACGLWLLQRRIARLIVPRFGRECAECGYDLKHLASGRCPECGTEFVKR